MIRVVDHIIISIRVLDKDMSHPQTEDTHEDEIKEDIVLAIEGNCCDLA